MRMTLASLSSISPIKTQTRVAPGYSAKGFFLTSLKAYIALAELKVVGWVKYADTTKI